MTVRVGLGYDVHPFSTDDDAPVGARGRRDRRPRRVCTATPTPTPWRTRWPTRCSGLPGSPTSARSSPRPTTRYRGASSMELLADVVARVRSEGWAVGNVDVVVNAEEPLLAGHLPAMVDNLTAVVGANVSVTPKRGEGVGAVGRGEAIAVWAVALLERDA